MFRSSNALHITCLDSPHLTSSRCHFCCKSSRSCCPPCGFSRDLLRFKCTPLSSTVHRPPLKHQREQSFNLLLHFQKLIEVWPEAYQLLRVVDRKWFKWLFGGEMLTEWNSSVHWKLFYWSPLTFLLLKSSFFFSFSQLFFLHLFIVGIILFQTENSQAHAVSWSLTGYQREQPGPDWSAIIQVKPTPYFSTWRL